MARIDVTADRRMAVPAETAFTRIANYDDRRAFLPDNYSEYTVEEGGTGGGTVVSYRFKAGPRERVYRMRAEEPEPGRMLVERDQDSSLVTTWTVTADGEGCTVRLETHWEGGSGVGGFFEKLFAPKALVKVHEETLRRLAGVLET